ncbi:hypothetical protein TW95_gp0890 [Pandoravirus inopinatum]|uniref:Morn repeat protein n=1 Tax=Pandoravirus inopinatum TaxID=1605721 RepID=A0A0B5J251_9VIRU|nr:hypothetical protein TW95_gp0890 [Pandoravirus inopinatum]AJF97624.1 hypothetical protein [Pandoravirus inopinatum]
MTHRHHAANHILGRLLLCCVAIVLGLFAICTTAPLPCVATVLGTVLAAIATRCVIGRCATTIKEDSRPTSDQCRCDRPTPSLDPSHAAFGPHWTHWKATIMASHGGPEAFDSACATPITTETRMCPVAGTRTGHLALDDGTVFRGQFLFRNGVFIPHGYAVRVAIDGTVHEGEWLAGEPEGMGFRTMPDRQVVHGYWSGENVDTCWRPPLWH